MEAVKTASTTSFNQIWWCLSCPLLEHYQSCFQNRVVERFEKIMNLVQCDFWMVVVATLEHYDFFSRGRPPTSGNLSTPAELWVSSSHFCRGHLYLWGKHIEIVSPILLQLLKTVNGGRLFSFLNVKLVLYNSQSLHWFTFQKWGFSWSWRLTNIENETIKFEDEWSSI